MPSLALDNITFAYPDATAVFDRHSLTLDSQPGLYGIIGPSGTGKTTLISILGGQLRPQSGQVLVDGVDIYRVDDTTRRTLLGIQMQTSTSLRGKLRYNLEFGIPDEHCEQVHTDEYLIELLQDVGLWDLFAPKQGLDTLIGEGGLNLSGGQRQRLNFAGLYLRAQYYQPTLLLVDEPTSSLDELSEQAITRMLGKLAQTSLVLVVAHRLKTLDRAKAILDSSLITSTQELKFLTRAQLRQKSAYYQALQSGTAILED